MFLQFITSFLNLNIIFILAGFFGAMIAIKIIIVALHYLGVYAILNEREAVVYTLFGNVVGVLNEAGIHFLWKELGVRALFVNWLGKKYKADLRLDQQYLRSQPVNSEEGAPMGVGLWYEMYITDPVAYTFRNTDPKGSLSANVGNSTVRCLSNLPLDKMMADRHSMSRIVRQEVSEKSREWGYKLGSCYVRKVHFCDKNMIQQIQNKVVNRLVQVTAAITQEGANQVDIITSTAERKAAIDFGKASAIRPNIVGKALNVFSQDAILCEAFMEILETNRIAANKIPLYVLPEQMQPLVQHRN